MEAASTLLRTPPPTKPFILHSSPHCLLLSLPLPTTKPYRGTSLIARAEPPDGGKVPSSEEASISSPPPPPPPLKEPGGRGAGFGSVVGTNRKRKSKERSSVIRRPPIERPPLYPGGEEGRSPPDQQQGANEGAFLLAWLGLGLLILVEGIALAASGFLPEEWDNFFVKYLYPSFTPTVFLFVAGTVAYGVVKYLQGERMKS